MSVQRDLQRRVRQDKARPRFEPCLPRSVKAPPSGDGWLHEIKHDGFRIIGYRDANGARLITRNGYDFTSRFPLATAAVASLPVRSCVIDSEAIACDDNGLAVFEMIRWRRYDHAVTLCAFDLLELDRTDIPGNPSRKGSAYWRSPSVAHIGAMPSQHRLKQIVQSIPIGGFQVLPNFATLLIATSNSDRKPINPPSLSF